MARILGISAFYHDSAAALVVDGRIVAAAQEERFTRQKHDASYPARAIEYCLREGNLEARDLDYVAFYEKPLVKFERLVETYLAFAPRGFASFRRAIPVWMREKLHLRRLLQSGLPGLDRARLLFIDHHESHAASAFFPSPFEQAAILTLDGVGEWTTTAWGEGRGNQLTLRQQLKFPHSLGLLYSAFTTYCGFKVNSGEYKLMGLAPFGRPVHEGAIYEHLLDLREDGSFWLDHSYFNYCQGLTMTNGRFHRLFGGAPRAPEAPIEQRHMDLAASIQKVIEEVILRIARTVHRETGMRYLVMAGGVALNCVANGRLLREGPFEDIWIQPAAGDAGGSLGAALFVHYQLLERLRPTQRLDHQQASLLGPAFTDASIGDHLRRQALPYRHFPIEQSLLEYIARALSEGFVIGWFHGRMEFGPRALGARSILADARIPTMQATVNLKVKFREGFRPFAPAVLRERAHEVFELEPGRESPYMLLVAPVRASLRRELTPEEEHQMSSDPDLRLRINIARSDYPAVTHVDYSARIQTVDERRHPRLHRLMKVFEALTGSPLLLNTSFNIRGEPIVCTPEDACRCFLATDLDMLVLENHVLLKADVPAGLAQEERQKHLARYGAD